MPANRKIRVLIVDDSAIVRRILSEALSGEDDIEIAGTAPDPYVARDKILALRPDVLTLDIEMPRMDGLTFLKKLMQFHPLPAIVISSLAQPSCRTAIQALESAGRTGKARGAVLRRRVAPRIAQKVRAAAQPIRRAEDGSSPRQAKPSSPGRLNAQAFPRDGDAVGASTGGTEAIAKVLTQLPASCPGIVVAQHIPRNFPAPLQSG